MKRTQATTNLPALCLTSVCELGEYVENEERIHGNNRSRPSQENAEGRRYDLERRPDKYSASVNNSEYPSGDGESGGNIVDDEKSDKTESASKSPSRETIFPSS